MACDRPLDKLDERPGPYIPNTQMPLKPPNSTQGAVPNARLPGTSPTHSPEVGQQQRPKKSAGNDPDKRGPQYWCVVGGWRVAHAAPCVEPRVSPHACRVLHGRRYNEGHDASNRAADQLPPQDVGPKLPPGGWRGNATAVPGGKLLPEISQPGSKRNSPPRERSDPPATPPLPPIPPMAQAAPAAAEAPAAVEDHAQLQMGMPSL